MKKGKNMINQKNDLNMITRKLETGLWYYIKDNGMIISHKDSFNHTIKNLIDEMIYDCHIEIEEVEETKATEEAEETRPCFYRGKRSTNYMTIEYWVTRDDIHKRLTGESEV